MREYSRRDTSAICWLTCRCRAAICGSAATRPRPPKTSPPNGARMSAPRQGDIMSPPQPKPPRGASAPPSGAHAGPAALGSAREKGSASGAAKGVMALLPTCCLTGTGPAYGVADGEAEREVDMLAGGEADRGHADDGALQLRRRRARAGAGGRAGVRGGAGGGGRARARRRTARGGPAAAARAHSMQRIPYARGGGVVEGLRGCYLRR